MKKYLDVELCEVFGPRWENGCSHSGYIGTIETFIKQSPLIIDVYVFENYDQEICLRFGQEPSEYLSPGGIMELFDIERLPYTAVARFLRGRGSIRWQANK